MEREGGKCKPVTASLLLTAPGLRDSSSLRFPRCRFNSFPSAQSSFFFLLAFYLLLLTDALHSSLSAFQDLRTSLFKKCGLCALTESGGRLQRTVLGTGTPTGTWSFLYAARVDSLFVGLPVFCSGQQTY